MHYDPCVVVLARVEAPRPPWQAIAAEAGPLQWVGCESSKREADGTLVALHGAAEWSRERFAAADGAVADELLAELGRIAGPAFSRASDVQVKRWRFAKPTILGTARALLSETPPLAFCGDWGGGPRAEGAWLSGLAAAERLVGAGYA